MTLAFLWATWHKYRTKSAYLLVALLLFGAGWQMGRIMSPWYSGSPIVFQDNSCDQSAGTSEQLALLKQAGSPSNTPNNSPAVAGAINQPTQEDLPAAPSDTDPVHNYAGSKNSNMYHHRDCTVWKRIKEENLIWWATPAEAEAAGYQPSKCTQDKLGVNITQ